MMNASSSCSYYYPSISSLLSLRSQGQCRSHVFLNRLKEKQSRKCLSRIQRIHSLDKCILSLDVHPIESHFVLAGSREGIVSIYDLSEHGSDASVEKQMPQSAATANGGGVRIHKPIARSMATIEIKNENGYDGDFNNNYIRLGSAICTRWYPADSGAFVTAHATGSLTIWDTNAMSLAARIVPFASEAAAAIASVRQGPPGAASSSSSSSALLSTMEISPLLHDLVAVGSTKFPTVRLVDIRSGACSHTLTGHRRGITSVTWSPTCPHILASGCMDGCIRLWDIRKAGRHGWIMDCFDQDYQSPRDLMNSSRCYRPDYSHLKRYMEQRNNNGAVTTSTTTSTVIKGKVKNKKTKTAAAGAAAGPNDYQSIATRQGSRSHDDAIGALAFDPVGHFLVSNGTEGMLKIWDLRGEGHLVPRRFQRTAANTQLQVVNDGGGGGSIGRGVSSSSSSCSSSFLPTTTTIWTTYGSTLRSYALEDGGTAPRQELMGHLKSIQAIKYIPDTGEIITGGADGVILLWTPAAATAGSLSSSRQINARQVHNMEDQRKRKRDIDCDSW